ncbi:MAG: hypothetical protein ABIY51_09670, partial [Ferruginibacter sp.]
NDAAKAILLNLLRSLYGSKVCVYGAWIFDNGHCCQPEIHPAEQIWWTRPAPGGKIYYFNLIADDSKRYWWRDQMDDGTKLRPWGAPPVTGTFAIAFETEVNTNRPVEMQIFNVANIHDRHVKAYPNTDHNYDLEYNGQTLIRFIPHNDAFYVRYSNVGLVPGTNKLRGFLVIQSTVGKATQIATKAYWLGKYIGTYPMGSDPDKVPQQAERSLFKKEEGHYLFTVTHTVQKPVVIQ